MTKCLILIAVILTGVFVPRMTSAAVANTHREWNFTVSIDGDPVGTHVFTVDGTPDEWHVTSKADFAMTILGITVFRYHHNAHEQWSNQCLSQLKAYTDHDGDISSVTAQAAADGGVVHVAQDADAAGEAKNWLGCLMTYAYWNPDMHKQQHLLNPETGEIENVTITQQQDQTVTSHGQQILAHIWRLTGSTNPIEVLYDNDGNWLGLNASVRGGHILSYRLP